MKKFTHVPLHVELPELEAVTTDSGRVYHLPNGMVYPSATTVLSLHTKAGIDRWRERVGEEEATTISRRAASRGTMLHNNVERYLKNDDLLTFKSVFPLFKTNEEELFTAIRPELDKIDNIRALEKTLYSHHLRMAGRVDCIAEYNKKLSIIDFKSSSSEKDIDHIQHYFMQGAAYAIMFEELTQIPITNIVIMIAVEDGFVQVMKGKRDDYVNNLLFYRDLYEYKHK